MSVLDQAVATEASITDLTARILALRDHLTGAKDVANPQLPAATMGGLLGQLQTATFRNIVITKLAADALAEIEAALGIDLNGPQPEAPVAQ
jgi:hypothetical protein